MGPALPLAVQLVRGLLIAMVHLLARAVPRRRDLWAFGSWYGTRYGGSPRVLFLHCLRRSPNAPTVVWITKDAAMADDLRAAGLPAYARWSLKGWWVSLRAGAYVVDCRSSDIGYPTSGGAVLINLWHGTPLKRIERDIQDLSHPYHRVHRGPAWKRLLWRILAPTNAETYDLVCAASPVVADRLAGAFGMPRRRIVIAEAPCNDVLVRGEHCLEPLTESERMLVRELELHRGEGRRILAYLPTFRDTKGEAATGKALTSLARILRQHHAVMYCKLHGEDRRALEASDPEALPVLDATADAHLLMHFADVLLTDYSSIYYDFLLVDRPVIFFAPDLDQYQRFSRTLYEPYANVTPGPVATNAEQLSRAVEELLSNYEAARQAYNSKRHELRAKMHEAPLPEGTFAELTMARLAGAGAPS